MINQQIPDFILDLNKEIEEETVKSSSQWGFYSTKTQQIPDFIQPKANSNSTISTTINQPNIRDTEVKLELGDDYDDLWDKNQEQVKEYIDSLSDDDYKIWTDLKNEWYSLNSRKALMDNRDDLYDITEPWNKKFWSANKSETMQTILDLIQDAVDYQEDTVHPWSQSKQEYLDLVSEELYKDTFENIYQEKYQDYLNTDNRLLRRVKSASMLPVSVVQRWATIAGWMLVDLAKNWIWLIDHLWNIGTQLFAAWGNKIAWYDNRYDLVQVDPESPNILWSYIKGVRDFLWAWFTLAYPFATWLLTTFWTESENVQRLMNTAHWWIKYVAKEIFETIWLKHFNLDSLSEEELEAFYDDIATWVFIIFADLTGKWINWLWKRQAVKDFLFIKNIAKETSEIGRQEIINQVKETWKTMEKEPVWTEFRTEWWTKMAEVTPDWVRTTPYWKLRIIQKVLWWRVNWWIRWFQWALEEVMNKDKLVTRDPNAPVWELPVPEVKIREEEVKNPWEGEIKEWEIKEPTVEEKPTEVKNPKDEIKTTWGWTKTDIKSSTLKTEQTWSSWILDFIKKTLNKISWKQGGMDQELFEKFSSSPDLQNEYINTIDPYLKENWAENPAWVIENQLSDFIDTAIEQLQDRRNNNIEFQKWQMKYKVQIPESDKIKRNQENTEIKNLIKTLSKQYFDSERFLDYLLNLPEEKVQGLNKFIPNFSNNLALIKDTLDLTKAITSSDLLWKFLQYKSTWWTKRRNFIRRYLWNKLKQAYEKAGIKRNMYEIEKILNKLSEEELVELEETMENDNIPAYMKQDFINNLYDKLDKKPIEAVEWKKIGDTTIQLSKKTREEIIERELTKQWYRRETDTTLEYKTEEELRQHKLSDWTTIWDWMDRVKANLSPKLLKDFRLSEADFWNKAINYNRNGLNMSSFVAWHEIAHFVLGKLTTSELFDLTERIRKLTKDSGKEINRVWMGEYLADTISNYLNHWDIDWLNNLLTKNLEWPKAEITEHIKNLLENFKKDKLYQDRAPRYENPRNQSGVTAWERMDFLRKVDPNLKDYSFDLDVDSPTFSEMRFNMNDWKSLSREEWKGTLSHDQYLKLYSSEDLFNLEKEIKNQSKKSDSWREDIKKEIDEAEAYFGKSKYEKYQKAVKNIDPDIIWLIEKDWQIYVKYLIESQRERYELPNRPWYLEAKEVLAKDYFTEEELNQLPKDLVAKIKKNAD